MRHAVSIDSSLLRRELLDLIERLVLPAVLHLGHRVAETRLEVGRQLACSAARRGR